MGHEYCGVVAEVGREVQGFRRGDRVVAPFCQACGTCEFCRGGHQNVCSSLQLPSMHFSGGYATLTKVANADVNLVPLPESVPSEAAAGLGCRL